MQLHGNLGMAQGSGDKIGAPTWFQVLKSMISFSSYKGIINKAHISITKLSYRTAT